MNALSFWLLVFGGLLLYYSFLAGGAPTAGWFSYAPLSSNTFSTSQGLSYWALGLLTVAAMLPCVIVVEIYHREIFIILIFENAKFRRCVGIEISVTIQVVGCDIEYDRHLGLKTIHGFELEAGKLHHRVSVVRNFTGDSDKGVSDIPAYPGLVPGAF